MFDSLYIDCPNCGKELFYQSKSGECMLSEYTYNNLSLIVAIGMDGDITMCEECGKEYQLNCAIPETVMVKLEEL